jgi:gamma-glutamyl AIG2-like cyclotransferase
VELSQPPQQPEAGVGAQASLRCLTIVDDESDRRFYDELIRYMHNAQEAFYRTASGWAPGFQRERQANQFRELLRAEEAALDRGVQFVRIQTGTRVGGAWADGYADLLERFPHRIRALVDFDNALFNDFGLVDPNGRNPIVYILFDTQERTGVGTRTRPAVALFIEDAGRLATILAQQFMSRAQELTALTPQDIRGLAQSYVYFGWGIHIASRKMLSDVPDARRLGVATLRGWRRDVSGLLAGPAYRATIRHTGDDSDVVEGVAYELSWWGRAQLDRLERRAYRPVPVDIETAGGRRSGFTYHYLDTQSSALQPPLPGSWVDLVIEGAMESDLVGLLDELRAAGAPVRASHTAYLDHVQPEQ